MILTIDNLLGEDAVDYSEVISADAPLTIERALNAPSRCTCGLDVGASANPGATPPLPVPVRRARIVVSSDGGTVLFTGYIATEPAPIYIGVGLAGPVYRVNFSAISDEWLLDKQTAVLSGAGFALAGGALLSRLATRTAAGLLSTSRVVAGKSVGVFTPQAAQPWSTNAAGIAASVYAAYRAIDGALAMQTVGSVTHALDFDSGEGDGALQAGALQTSLVKELANDITVSGEIEPDAFVTEMFQGDGTTAIFQLSDPAFHISRPMLLNDSFNQPAINVQTWDIADPGSHLSLGGGGLTFSGGTGLGGQSTLTAIDQLEIGGSLVIEAGNVRLDALSDGMLCGLYTGPVLRANCFAGYNVRQNDGSTLITPFLNGAEIGNSYVLLESHSYTLRIRVHSPEMQRVRQTYYARVDGVIESFGGGIVPAPVSLVFDVVDLGNSSNTPATVLYDGMVATSPANCTFAAVDSVALLGSMGSCSVAQTGSVWIVSSLPGGTRQTRMIGIAGEGVDCTVSSTGKVTFFAGRIPLPNEIVTFLYRSRTRAVSRLANAASIAAEATGGMPGTSRWLGKVVKPLARTTEDCESAVMAALSLACSRAAAISGTYVAVNPADIWPGDVLAITANGQTMNVVVRQVAIVDGHARPELLTYRIAFANDWAESLGMTLSEAIAADAYLPPTAPSAPGAALADLQQLAVIGVTTTALQIDAGTAAPIGGGFEVRRRDFNFGVCVNPNLVLRSPVRSFSIPRCAQVERYYVRTYDASNPPLYSRHSSAVLINLPVA